jgi:phenylpropionate dioxygenase-like ring-hydroxylating dioxygenase large terminal subunit
MSRLRRFEMQPRREWYAVALSADLKRSPRAVSVLGTRFVIYRDTAGAAVAHLDRCPHRNVPLSRGRCLDENTLECPYHGWRFRPDGSCSLVPGKTAGPKSSHRVETFATCEKYGVVWVCPELGQVPTSPPRSIPEMDSNDYTKVIKRVEFPAGLHAVVENALDVPHTSILHRGLFRGGARNRVRVILRRYSNWAEAEYQGEPPPKGLVARLLNWGASGALEVQHFDRFYLPNLLQVEYRLGPRTHFLISGFCTPVSEQQTDLYAVVCLRTPLGKFLERLLARVLEPFAMKVFRQDVKVLKLQTENLEHFGEESFMSTEIDVLGSSITRLLKEAYEHERRPVSPLGDKGGAMEASPDFTAPNGEVPREVTEIELDA